MKNIDADKNLLTVVRADGSERTYDPHRQQGVSVYRDQEKAFSVEDRLQFTTPAKSDDLKVANRELGTIQSIADGGRLQLKMDQGGRSVNFDPKQHPHLDHGYAVTSHASQEQTADWVLIHIDTEFGANDLLNNRMAYVARLARSACRANLHQRPGEAAPGAKPGCLAPERPCTRVEAGSSEARAARQSAGAGGRAEARDSGGAEGSR